MSSFVENIVTAIENNINIVDPTYVKSPNIFDFESNSLKMDKKVYGVRAQNRNTVPGANQAITMEQYFHIVVGDEIPHKGADNDWSTQQKVFDLSLLLENISKRIYANRLGLPYVLLVSKIDISAPNIDNKYNIINITGAFTIRYYMEY